MSQTTSAPVSSPILDTIHGPEDISRLDMACLPQLAREIRAELLEVISRNGGHLASNLGVVELTIALLRAFNPPKDKVVMDTSHQGYVYKLLTGRRELFKTLRQDDGCCGFLNREESPFDHFGAGHAGTAISAALGFAAARDNAGSDEKVIAIVGDGAMGNGISLEGLNNIVESTHDIVVILNDNKMSIGENVGALSRYFNRIISGHCYNQLKDATAKAMDKIPAVGRPLRRGIRRVIEGTKSMLLPGGLFEDFGLKYVGPINGHDIDELVHTFESVASLHEPVLIHVLTEKGRGYKFATELPEVFHGTGQFDTSSGLPVPAAADTDEKPVTFSEAYGGGLERLMKKDQRVVTITAGMCKGTGVDNVRKAFPKRFYDVGIAEEHAAVFAAGLAAAGLRPVVGMYATFMHRAVDCVLHDICLQNLPVIFCLDRAGVVQDGPTHHGIHDVAFWVAMPNLTVMQPMDARELEAMLALAVTTGSPTIIRYPKGSAESVPGCAWTPLQLGEAVTLREGTDVALWSLGRECVHALDIADTLEKQGVSVAVVNPRFVAPFDTGLLFEQAAKMPVVTLEDHSLAGGLGELISLKLARAGYASPLNLGWPAGVFIPHGSDAGLREKYELTHADVARKISQFLK
ncbi:MAG: 1-deoxy-D-xylulose-5-phosphate synthase [Lentisphaeria bacterium]|nr:1-deoxy-D-xylulose-5-phosphate synthase [Lentisphaeria bacterium]